MGYFLLPPGASGTTTTSEACVCGSGTRTIARESGWESGSAEAAPSVWLKALRKSSEMRLNSEYTSAEGGGEAAGGWNCGGFSSTGSDLGVTRVKLVGGSAFGNGEFEFELISELLV